MLAQKSRMIMISVTLLFLITCSAWLIVIGVINPIPAAKESERNNQSKSDNYSIRELSAKVERLELNSKSIEISDQRIEEEIKKMEKRILKDGKH